MNTIRITFQCPGNVLGATKAIRDNVPGLDLKAAKLACEAGAFDCPADRVDAVVAALKPLCKGDVTYYRNERDAAEARFVRALGNVEDRITTRFNNFLADILEKIA